MAFIEDVLNQKAWDSYVKAMGTLKDEGVTIALDNGGGAKEGVKMTPKYIGPSTPYDDAEFGEVGTKNYFVKPDFSKAVQGAAALTTDK